MTKQQKIYAGLGGVYGLCVLALGWFLYSAYAEHQEILDGGEATPVGLVAAKTSYANSYSQENPFPSRDSIDRVKANEKAYAEWRESNFREVSKGDCPPPPSKIAKGEGTVLFEMMREWRKKTLELPGGAANGKVCAPTFLFGFDSYLEEGDKKQPMPADPKQLTELYTQFVMITNMVDILHASGGSVEIRKIKRNNQELKGDDESADKQANKRKKGGKAKSAKGAAVVDKPKCYNFDLEFSVRPSAFVNVLNAFATCPRFFVVEDLEFKHEGEMLKDRLNQAANPSKSKDEQQTVGRQGRSRGRGVQEKKEKKVEFDGDLVTRPDLEKPILVTMKLSVYDFGTGNSQKEDK